MDLQEAAVVLLLGSWSLCLGWSLRWGLSLCLGLGLVLIEGRRCIITTRGWSWCQRGWVLVHLGQSNSCVIAGFVVELGEAILGEYQYLHRRTVSLPSLLEDTVFLFALVVCRL